MLYPHLSRPKYRPDIDGLRAVAVLAVVAFHAFPDWIKGGFIGVDVFFVISGYLISTIIIENINKGSFSFAEFYTRRIKRIFPALILVFVSCFAFGWFTLLADEFKQLSKHIAAGAAFVSNVVLWKEFGYFDSAADTKLLLHLWSLGVEEQFYIVWPVSLWFAYKKRINPLIFSVIVAIASFCFNLYLVKTDIVANFYSLQARFWELMLGGILAWRMLDNSAFSSESSDKLIGWNPRDISQAEKKNVTSFLVNIVPAFALLLIGYGFWHIDKNIGFPGIWALIPTISAILIITVGANTWVNRVILSNKLFVWFGLISFPLYLWHWPLLSFARIVEGEVPNINIRISAVFLSIVLSWFTYKFIETPIRFGGCSKAKAIALVILMMTVGFVGYYSFEHQGLVFRVRSYESIHKAVQDWEYPRGLFYANFQGTNVYYNKKDSQNKVQLVLFGDSHIEQYGPKVVKLTQDGTAKNLAIMAVGGCLPVPNVYEDKHKGCDKFVDTFQNFLDLHEGITDIVISACFNCYFIQQSGAVTNLNDSDKYYFKDHSGIHFFGSDSDGEKLAIQEFISFIEKLQTRYRVLVMMDNPQGHGGGNNFDPKAMLKIGNRKRPIFLSKSHLSIPQSFARSDEEIQLENSLTEMLKAKGVTVINQSNLICPNNVCSPIDNSGRPIYKDGNHMRPFFVKEKMNVLDNILKP